MTHWKINKNLRHMVEEVIELEDAIGVYLNRPYVFKVTGASTTFFDLEDCAADGLDPWDALNECIAEEAQPINPETWDKG